MQNRSLAENTVISESSLFINQYPLDIQVIYAR